jgi:hypothetical protein
MEEEEEAEEQLLLSNRGGDGEMKSIYNMLYEDESFIKLKEAI